MKESTTERPSESPVLSEVIASKGILTLNSEKSLNSLTLPMIEILTKKLKEWEKDPLVECVILKGNGPKAFCAGGDVVRLYESIANAKDGERENLFAFDFFNSEYRLDYFIHTYSKPILCFAHGIVMGGGVGLMNGARFRIVTEKTLFAMPEVTIGLYPDVGASYFLNTLPKHLGLFIALTGARLNCSDLLYTKLADHLIQSTELLSFEQELLKLTLGHDSASNTKIITELLQAFEKGGGQSSEFQKLIPPSQLQIFDEQIQKLMEGDDILTIEANVKRYVAATSEDNWLKKSLSSFLKGSPTSKAVIFQQLHPERELTLKEAFSQELSLSLRFCAGFDLEEGIRALLIDKDNAPVWDPETLEDLDPEELAGFWIPFFDHEPFADL